MNEMRDATGDGTLIDRRGFFTRTLGLAGAAGVVFALSGCPGGESDDEDGGDNDGGGDNDNDGGGGDEDDD